MYSNDSNIDLPFAVWLAADGDYDLDYQPDVLSATDLLKPAKALAIVRQLHHTGGQPEPADIADRIPSRIGTAIHHAAEQAWRKDWKSALHNLRLSEQLIKRVKINPRKPLKENFNVFLEQRSQRELNGMTISGKFDLVMDGNLVDYKSTKVFNYIKGSREGDYRLQGSIYRWLNPDLIKGDTLHIAYLFLDWVAGKADTQTDYPPHAILTKELPLLTLEQTEQWISERIDRLLEMSDMAQEEMPLCTAKEMWQDPPKWAYYKNPAKRKRSTANFDLLDDAQIRLHNDGNVGVIEERPAIPRFCIYCPARGACLQAENHILSGLLKPRR